MVDYVHYWCERTAMPMSRLVGWLGLARSKFYDWRERYGLANEHNAPVPRDFWLEDWERAAIVVYARAHPLEGYRRLAFMMLDDDVVAVSPSSVYRVLVEAQLMHRWERKLSKKGTGFVQPLRAHEHWHVDVTYINLCGTFYYLCSLLDGYSRYLVHWEIRERMTEQDVEVVVQRAREKFPDARPRIISDNGPQFIAKDFKEFLRLAGMTHVRISPGYPESNGKKERFYQTLKSECIRPGTPLSLEDARRIIAAFIEHYNTVRLHSAIGYVAPLDKLEGRAEAIWAERDRKLAEGRETRRARRAEARLHGSAAQLLTPAKETPMIHPAGETDAGSAGEHPARDSRPGRRMTVEGEPTGSPNPHPLAGGMGHPEPPDASENSDWPKASRLSESLISEGCLSSSR
ncbi:MAG: IS3 family transposase [Spirochaetales bacterium]|nr:IS3 family transposase [Spirochaetales bacterium]